MTQIVIDAERAIELLRNRVQGNEDFVYPRLDGDLSCKYESDGCPSCLIGCVLFDTGVSVEDLKNMDLLYEKMIDTDIGSLYALDNLPSNVRITRQAVDIFSAAQSAQDTGLSWGKALEKAEMQYSSK